MRERLIHEAGGAALLLGAVLVAAALISHSPMDPSPLHVSTLRSQPHNLVGWLGATLSAALLSAVGLSSFLLPLLGAVVGWRLLRRDRLEHPRVTSVGWILVFASVPGFLDLLCRDITLREGTVSCGGVLGRAGTELLGAFAGPVGRVVVLSFVLLLGLLLTTGVSLAGVLDRFLARLRTVLEKRKEERSRHRQAREKEKNRQRVLRRQLERMPDGGEYQGTVTVKELEGRGRFRIVRKVAGSDPEPEENAAPDDAPRTTTARRQPRKQEQKQKASAAEVPAPPPAIQEEFDFVEDLDRYDLPKSSFLEQVKHAPTKDKNALIEISKTVTNKCQEFRVRGEVVNIRTGPVITTYEFRLDSGVKISAVQNLAEDLALALKTEAVRIERIPGRATVGIEVPNPDPEEIRLAELVESSEFRGAASLLTLSLGVDIRGKPFFADLARMPHLLIGGFTGSGKSVGINAMIMSILFRARPEQVKFIMVDPKMVELGVYSDIPHLLTPIITDPKKAANALGWAVAEMDTRYHRLAALGVRNLGQYNAQVSDPVQLRRARDLLGIDSEEVEEVLEPLPVIVIIIDELADLMMTSSRAVEEAITRLAQKARAVGIHLICATQRPSVDILTGIIKANFTCRIAYKVRSKFDSRTILDGMGAEHLLGRGDMLFLPPGSSSLIRLHGPLVSEKEIATVVRYITRFGKPDYLREVITHAALGGDRSNVRRTDVNDEDSLEDPAFDKAARLVVKTRKASASFVQRRLRLGYTRAARLIDMMEREGLVGPLNGSKGREVLVPPDYFEEVDETHLLSDGGLDDGT